MAWGRYSLHMLCHFKPFFQVSNPVWVCCISTPIFCTNWAKCLVLNLRFGLIWRFESTDGTEHPYPTTPPPPPPDHVPQLLQCQWNFLKCKGVNFGRYIWLNVFLSVYESMYLYLNQSWTKYSYLYFKTPIFLYKFVFVFVRGWNDSS